tara:strand:+ start:604 stop:891 length:288 start_codon:yes stop_codon:yes gene_type:complete
MAVRKTKKGAALRRWFKEDWTTPSGKKDYSSGENTFRPTKKISKKTPKTWSQLSKGEKAAASREKTKTGRVSRYKAGGKMCCCKARRARLNDQHR